MENLLKQLKKRQKLFKSYGYDIRAARRYIFQKSGIRPGAILEIGTGKGYFTAELASHGLEFVSIDIDRKEQTTARKYLRAVNLTKNVELKIMDAECLTFKDGTFDCVASVNLVHHLDNPRRCLKEMMRVAKEKLIIADINKRGHKILNKIHGLDGSSHRETKMNLTEVKNMLETGGFLVKTYRHTCQTILVARKKSGKETS